MKIFPIFLILIATPALAETPEPDPMPSKHVLAFGRDNPKCLEWTDGCTICKRIPVEATACSTPGIACLPQEPACKKSAP